MHVLTVSRKYQVVIPKEIRVALGIRPGSLLQMMAYSGRIELVKVRAPRAARGFLRGVDSSVPRDPDRL